MTRAALPGLVLLIAVLTAATAAPPVASAVPANFELDLKELRKPLAPLPAPAKQSPPPAAPQPKTAPSPETKKKAAQKTARPARPPLPKKTLAQQKPAERVVVVEGATACQVGQQLLQAITEPVPAAKLLQGLALPVAAAGRHQGSRAVLACDLPTAEAYTFARLLEADGVALINVTADQSAGTTCAAVARALGLSCRRLQGQPPSYQVRDHQGRPVRLLIGVGH